MQFLSERPERLELSVEEIGWSGWRVLVVRLRGICEWAGRACGSFLRRRGSQPLSVQPVRCLRGSSSCDRSKWAAWSSRRDCLIAPAQDILGIAPDTPQCQGVVGGLPGSALGQCILLYSQDLRTHRRQQRRGFVQPQRMTLGMTQVLRTLL
jgi:hypothetical protein